ncbi:MAG TPA: transcription elongation factor GreA [Clostridia bacterium]|nr:transcription elongation factor GreA [Clostridia bacterium]
MAPDRSAPGLLRAVGLLADGPVVWGRPVPANRPGVFVVELTVPRASAPIELTRVGKWIERVETLRLDGERPTSRRLAARLAAFWLPSQVVLYVGATPSSIATRVKALRVTALGDRRPHSGGHWLHVLTGIEGARIWWAATDAVEESEDALLSAFAEGVPEAERATLPDREIVLPFANLRTATGDRKRTGLSGSLIVEPAAAPPPPTRIVQLPDGDADGARGEPPAAALPAPPPARAAATRAPGRAKATARGGRPADPVHLTADGADRLRDELRTLIDVRRPEVVARIRTAKELGDLKENADYTAAREEQSFLEGRIQAIEAQLRAAVIIETPAAGSRVGLGTTVTVEAMGEEATYVLVGTTEADPAQGRISVSSPVGAALVGHGPGDEVLVKTPRGETRYRVLAVG